MPIMNTLTDVIANPKRVRASQERASERRFSGLEQKMAAVRDISPELTPSQFSGHNSSLSSRAPSQDRGRRPPLRQPELQRSQSELPIQARLHRQKPEFTPDITAMDLTSEQIKRNYSVDDLQKWDKTRYPLPPLAQMRGNFRYRTAEAADPEWRNAHFKKQIYGLDGLDNMVAELDMKDMTGISNEEWQVIAGSNARRDSAISSNSTATQSTTSLQDAMTDPNTGPRVCRGFSPSRSSSARSSFHSRKNSTLSIMNLPLDPDASLFQKPLQRQSTFLNDERRSSNPLSTINELQLNIDAVPDCLKKVARPCEFTDSADPDSAVASDNEDEEDAAWSDVAESRPTRVSVITQMLKEGKKPEPQVALTRVRTTSSDKKRGRCGTAALDRSKTIRGARPPSKTRQTRTKLIPHERVKSDEKKGRTDAAACPTPESVEDDGLELTMHIRKPSDSKEGAEFKAATLLTEAYDNTSGVENQTGYLPRAPRNRSTTALFCQSGVQATTSKAREEG